MVSLLVSGGFRKVHEASVQQGVPVNGRMDGPLPSGKVQDRQGRQRRTGVPCFLSGKRYSSIVIITCHRSRRVSLSKHNVVERGKEEQPWGSRGTFV